MDACAPAPEWQQNTRGNRGPAGRNGNRRSCGSARQGPWSNRPQAQICLSSATGIAHNPNAPDIPIIAVFCNQPTGASARRVAADVPRLGLPPAAGTGAIAAARGRLLGAAVRAPRFAVCTELLQFECQTDHSTRCGLPRLAACVARDDTAKIDETQCRLGPAACSAPGAQLRKAAFVAGPCLAAGSIPPTVRRLQILQPAPASKSEFAAQEENPGLHRALYAAGVGPSRRSGADEEDEVPVRRSSCAQQTDHCRRRTTSASNCAIRRPMPK